MKICDEYLRARFAKRVDENRTNKNIVLGGMRGEGRNRRKRFKKYWIF